MKWNHIIAPQQAQENEEEDSDEEIQQLKQRIRIRKRERLKEVKVFLNLLSKIDTFNKSSIAREKRLSYLQHIKIACYGFLTKHACLECGQDSKIVFLLLFC